MSASPLVVLKFGGSVLLDDAALPRVVREIYRHLRAGRRVLAVTSAQGTSTDRLVARSREIAGEAGTSSAYASFLASGETRSAAALALAADAAGIPTALVEAERLGLVTEGSSLAATPVRLEGDAVALAFEGSSLVVVPGFVGVDESGDRTLLGRGGSDMTAIFLAARLEAERCVLIKDVDGWYVEDPAVAGVGCPRFDHLAWADAIAVPAPIVQDRAVVLARRLGRTFEVAGLGSGGGTRVGPAPTSSSVPRRGKPVDVVLLGCGTVGAGVARHLLDAPEHYRIRSILVRDLSSQREDWLPRELLTDDPEVALAHRGAVVVELMGGVDQAGPLVQRAQMAGPVVTANKRLLAEESPFRPVRSLGRSAAVGGAVPMLEAVERVAAGVGVESLRGVLNGTCNWILDALGRGESYPQAVRRAQELGFAEEDPSGDVSGLDAAHKLALLVAAAAGQRVDLAPIRFRGIEAATSLRAGPSPAHRLRLIARWQRSGSAPSIGLEWLAPYDPLWAVEGERNALEIVDRAGVRISVSGRGAGRWPTALSVMADLDSLRLGSGLDTGLEDRPHEVHAVLKEECVA